MNDTTGILLGLFLMITTEQRKLLLVNTFKLIKIES